MPRFEPEEGTPCPVRSTVSSSSSSHFSELLPAFDRDDGDTQDLDYTRALPEPGPTYRLSGGEKRPKGLKGAPRRITGYVPPPRRRSDRQEQTAARKTSIEEPTAPEIYAAVAAALEPEKKPMNNQPRRSMLRGISGKATRRRISALVRSRVPQHVPVASDHTQTQRQSLEKDKSQASILADSSSHPPNIPVHYEVPAPQEEKKRPQAPPKRPVLQPATRVPQTSKNTMRERNSGKENVPPGERGIKKQRSALTSKPSQPSILAPKPAPARVTAYCNRKRSSDSADESFSSDYSDASCKRKSAESLRLVKRHKGSMESLPSPPSLTAEEEEELRPPTDFLLPGILLDPRKSQSTTVRPLDPVLTEDLVRCEMYEEEWLSAQESSVTQLLNQLLTQYSPAPVGKPRQVLRKEFLALYTSPPFPLVHKRVHASLLYGALSVSKSLIEKSSSSRLIRSGGPVSHLGWGTDVGLREKYIELLTGSYEQSLLAIALEVVVGRDMFAAAAPGTTDKRIIENFIDRYLIRSEDLLAMSAPEMRHRGGNAGPGNEDEDKGTPAWLLRRSLLRSFLLILLLDKAKAKGIVGRQCLFKKSSTLKSSSAVLCALSKLLLPSMNDVTRPLTHLNYTLEATQTPLTEYGYTITNIAVDMRDGVRLARVTEVLMHSKQRLSLLTETLDEDEEKWHLTPHLQYPAPSKAQKLHNVSIVLTSLDSVGGNPARVDARAIADGHREKTVGLLWNLLSRWGLDLLVDWDTVRREIRRLSMKNPSVAAVDDKCLVRMDYTSLLKKWACLIAAPHGLKVDNLTTSFADGMVFGAIVAEYEQYLPSLSKQGQSASLEAKLKGIGCNSYFAELFGSITTNNRVFDKDFVVAALAYLCSRLLQLSVQERAAIMIQRTYRRHVFRSNIHKRIGLLLLAHDCAEVVNARAKITDAAITIQRAYRSYLSVRIQKFNDFVSQLQTAARGFIVRRSFEDIAWAATVIQHRWKAIRDARFHERMGIAKNGVVGFQAVARGLLVREKVSRMKETIQFVQERWRTISLGMETRQAYLTARYAAAVIQYAFRRYNETKHERVHLVNTLNGLRGLQTLARGVVVRQRCEETVSAAARIQRWYAGTSITRRVRTDFINFRNSTIILQRAWRNAAWLVRMRRVVHQAVVIQSAWRAFLVRRESGPRLRIIKKRLDKTLETGVAEEDSIGGRTKWALEMVKSKNGFARGIQQIESVSTVSRECAILVAKDDAGLSAITEFVETAIPQVQKSASSIAARNVMLASKVLFNIARFSPTTSGRPPKDIFVCSLAVLQGLKLASANTPQHDILIVTLKTIKTFADNAAVRRKLLVRKKLVDKLTEVMNQIKNVPRKRGAQVDIAKDGLVESLLGCLVG